MEIGIKELIDLLWLLAPLIILQIVLMIISVWDWSKKRVLLGQKEYIWLLVILLINMIGPIVYLIYSKWYLPEKIGSSQLDEWEV